MFREELGPDARGFLEVVAFFPQGVKEEHTDCLFLDGSRWITTEDVNVEHLFDVFTLVDTNLETIWAACSGFMDLGLIGTYRGSSF